MSRHNGLPGYDSWKTRSDLDDAPQEEYDPNCGMRGVPEIAVFTESDVDKLVEEMRAKCEAIARLNPFAHALNIANAIAALRRR